MISIRKSNQRGHANHGWLDTFHTFSFAGYYDPSNMGFRSLRVINEDRVAPQKGFGMHPHDNMEILTYVLSGQLAHKDTLGEQHVLGPNEIQKMSAGTGILHSEFNASAGEPVHLLQIWIEPNRRNLTPSYQQFGFAPEEKRGKWRLLGSPDPHNGVGVVQLNQDAHVYVGAVSGNETLQLPLRQGRGAWVHVVSGDVTVNEQKLTAGDAAAIEGESHVRVAGSAIQGEVLLFDLA